MGRRDVIFGLGLLLVALGLVVVGLVEPRPVASAHDQASPTGAAGVLPGSDDSSPPSKSARPAGRRLALLERLVKSGQLTPLADGGWEVRNAALQDLLQVLAEQADLEYLHNEQLTGENFQVSGHLTGAGDPRKQIEEFAFLHGVTCFVMEGALYPIEPGGKLPYPDLQWTFQPRHLKFNNHQQVEALIKPLLSATGTVSGNPVTNTITVSDSYLQVARAEELLVAIDQPKSRVSMDVQIVNVGKSDSTDWTSSFRDSETAAEMAAAVNTVLGLDQDAELAGLDEGGPQQHHFQRSEVDEVLRTLRSQGQLEHIAQETLTTLDNEQVSSSFSLRDSPGPEGRIVVTPTVLPDGTLRMQVQSWSLTTDPEPDAIEAGLVARVPDGQSLVIGGALTQGDGDSNLVMIVTPTGLPPEADESSSAPRPSSLPNPLVALLNR